MHIKSFSSLAKSLFILLLILILSTCQTESPLEADTPVKPETIYWDIDSNGYYQFYTDDPAKYNMSYFKTIQVTNSCVTNISIAVKRNSGFSAMGNGFYFNYLDDLNYYRILLTVNGSHRVTQRTNGQWSVLADWQQSGNAFTGYGEENIINIRLINGNIIYSLNGGQIGSISNSLLTNGNIRLCGYVSSISNEDFPSNPVDVRYKVLTIE
jgi:hypothetical protein